MNLGMPTWYDTARYPILSLVRPRLLSCQEISLFLVSSWLLGDVLESSSTRSAFSDPSLCAGEAGVRSLSPPEAPRELDTLGQERGTAHLRQTEVQATSGSQEYGYVGRTGSIVI